MPKTYMVVDLFAGVGGLSLGAARAGFKVKVAVDHDERAIGAHGLNFPNAIHLHADVASLRGHKLRTMCSMARYGLHGLIGGPPCQGFSAIGHRRPLDPRNILFDHFFRLVSEVEPYFFVAENVPGVLAARNQELLTNALSKIPERYVVLPPLSIKASDYGVPTTRTRVFFIGYDPNRMDRVDPSGFLLSTRDANVTVGDALHALPGVRPHWNTCEKGWRSVGVLQDTEFSRRIMGMVPPQIGDERALRLYTNKRLVSGFLGTMHTPETVCRFDALGPGELDQISRYRRLDRQGYCPTLRAGTDSERGSFQAARPVHPSSPRVITPREAARLQGFPDWFQFDSTKWHSFRQIGSSVSPIVGELVMSAIRKSLPS